MKKLVLLWVAISASVYGQSSVNLATLTVSAEATSAINAWMATQFSGQGSYVASLISPGDTTINVESTTGIGANSAILVGSEAMRVTGKTATTLTVTRGYLGTVASTFPVKTTVKELVYPTVNALFRGAITTIVGQIMEQVGSTTISTQNAVVQTANQVKQAAKDASVQ